MRLTTFYRMSLVAVVLALLFALVAGTSQGAMNHGGGLQVGRVGQDP